MTSSSTPPATPATSLASTDAKPETKGVVAATEATTSIFSPDSTALPVSPYNIQVSVQIFIMYINSYNK
jgi:hypothetical protein